MCSAGVLRNAEEATWPKARIFFASEFRSGFFCKRAMGFHHLFAVWFRLALAVVRGALGEGLTAALFAVIIAVAATSALAQTVALGESRAPAAASFSARAAADRPLTVHLSFRPRNRKALAQLLTDLQDPASRQYHRWLTPQQFSSRFGRTQTEVQAVSQWLSEHGLRVMHSSNNEIISAATVAQAEETFATTIAASADGASYANAAEPRIPARFADVIGSIDGLDNLRHWVPIAARPKRLDIASKRANGSSGKSIALPLRGRAVARTAIFEPAGSSPAFGDPNFGPQDLWTFYNETPPINGATDGGGGDCIGLIEDSDYLDAAVSTFDSNFSIPAANVTRVFADTSSPGTNSDETEALLDIEWAHVVAPGAPVKVYVGNPAFENLDPLTDSILKAISDNACGAISFSYVFCGGAPSFYTATLDFAFKQAAAQGQSVFAASGDWGSAGLDLAGSRCVTATTQNVSETSADPNVTSVGGTQFVPNYDAQGSDVGNVPETAWSDSGATGGGKSAFFAKPAYQNSVTPDDGMRDVPDIAAAASNVTPGFFWFDDKAGVPTEMCCIGGTSLSTPVWAGISKLIAQLKNGRLGNMNPRIYQLGALGDVSKSGLRDVVSGANGFNGVVGFEATPGYDLTTGWGSPDVQTFEAAFLSATVSSTPTPTSTSTATVVATPTVPATRTTTPTATLTPTLTATPNPTVTATTTQAASPTASETPTAVRVGDLRATSYQEGTQLQWRAGHQPGNLGFRVYREVNGAKALISPDLIAGAAFRTGPRTSLVADPSYSWWDSYANAGTRYWIEELDITGAHSFYGPVIAAQGSGNAPAKQNSALLHELGAAPPASQLWMQPAGVPMAVGRVPSTAAPVNLMPKNAIKLGISQPGWYHIAFSTLLMNGFNPGDGTGLHLYAEGIEQPLELRPGAAEFYGTGLDTPSTATRVYWLVKGAVSKDHIGTSTASGGPSAGTDFLASVELRGHGIYFPAANTNSGINFFGQMIESAPVNQVLTTAHLSQSNGATLEVGLQGGSAGPHQVTVALNGVVLGTLSFADLILGVATFPASSIIDGDNTVTLTPTAGGDVSLIDHITLNYERTYTADGNTLEFSAPGSSQVVVSGFTTSSARMIDITNTISNSSTPVELTVIAGGAGSFAATTPGTGPHTILAFGADHMAMPDSFSLHKPSKLTPLPAGVNTILITTANLTSAVQPLVKLRTRQKMHVRLVDIAQVYDAFSFGEKDPQAIKSFLAATQSGRRPPHYVLLVGDASYDPRNFLNLATNSDLVPTRLLNTGSSQAASDGWFADFANNSKPELAIGRLPVENATDLTALVAKIVAYDSVAQGNALLMASDASDPGVTPTFTDSSNSLAASLQAGTVPTMITRDPISDNHAALISNINSSPDLVNFIGHGNDDTWAASWLTAADASTLANSGHPAFFVMMTCDNGFFINPNADSLAEALLRAKGGAVAVWASSGATMPSGQQEANLALYKLLFPIQTGRSRVTPPSIGDAVRQAQNLSSDSEVRQTWNLLGDPETHLR